MTYHGHCMHVTDPNPWQENTTNAHTECTTDYYKYTGTQGYLCQNVLDPPLPTIIES